LRTAYSEWRDPEEPRRKDYRLDAVDLLYHPETHFVAIGKTALGEGAKRFAFHFQELEGDWITAVGKPLVAKASRLEIYVSVDVCRAADAHERFRRVVCSTQQLARPLAVEFKRKLDEHRRRPATASAS
jgi:hypothetical protein